MKIKKIKRVTLTDIRRLQSIFANCAEVPLWYLEAQPKVFIRWLYHEEHVQLAVRYY